MLRGGRHVLPQLMQQVRAIYERRGGALAPCPAEQAAMEADEVAEALLGLGHSVTVRTALGGGGGGECLRNLRHVFLSVRVQARARPCCHPLPRACTHMNSFFASALCLDFSCGLRWSIALVTRT
jgi:hypothetical protein